MIENGQKEIINNLKKWRLEKSKSLKVPAYTIILNNAIENIAVGKPQNEDQLLKIKGVGKAISEKFGDEILSIILNSAKVGNNKSYDKNENVLEKENIIGRPSKNYRIFPRLEQIEQSFKLSYSKELISFARHLNNKISSDWEIHVKPYLLNGDEIDIILLHESKGLMIIKIKDWSDNDLKNYELKHPDNDEEYEDNKTGKMKLFFNDEKISDPFLEISRLRSRIIYQLIPSIGEYVDGCKNIRKKFCAIRTGYYFPKVSRTKALEKFRDQEGDMKKLFLLAVDVLDDNELFDNRIKNFDKERQVKEKNIKESWNKNLLQKIRTELIPSYHKIEHGTYIKLTEQQEKYVKPMPYKYQILEGVAGSGKSLVIGQRAARLASEEKDVLILSFNITLFKYLKDQVYRAMVGFWPKYIKIHHFHKLCWDYAQEYNIHLPSIDSRESLDDSETTKIYREEIPKKVIESLQKNKNNIRYKKYDAILIDEGQDFSKEMFSMLNYFLKKDNDEMLIVFDEKQNIYDNQLDWIDKKKADRGKLNKNYRIPEIYIPVINKFAELYLTDNDPDIMKGSKQQAFPFMRPKFIWEEMNKIDVFLKQNDLDDKINCVDCGITLPGKDGKEKRCENCNNKINDCCISILKYVDGFIDDGNKPSDIAVLVPTNEVGRLIRDFLLENKHKVIHTFGRNQKLEFNLLDDRIKVSTIHSFKGWEMVNVIVLTGLGDNVSIKSHRVIYTSLTRALNSLIILNRQSNYVEFGRFLKDYNAMLT